MAVAIHLIETPGIARDRLVDLLGEAGATITVAAPGDEPSVPACDAAVFLANEDPLANGGVPGPGVVLAWADAAAGASARFVLCSSVLLYADGGETELMANDPELEPPPELKPLEDAELELFGSSAEVLLLRLGVVLGSGNGASASLVDSLRAGTLKVPSAEHRFVPLLDRETLAAALAAVADSRLHGGWDLVADDAPLEELLPFAARTLDFTEPGSATLDTAIVEAGSEAAARWLVSRRVTGRDLRETGAVEARNWREIVTSGLS